MARRIQNQPGLPRWVKMSAIVGGSAALLIVVMLASGHGPGRHFQGPGAMSMPAPAEAPPGTGK